MYAGRAALTQARQPQLTERPRSKAHTPQRLRQVGAEPGPRALGVVHVICRQRRDHNHSEELAEVDDRPDGEGEAGRREERRPRAADEHVCVIVKPTWNGHRRDVHDQTSDLQVL